MNTFDTGIETNREQALERASMATARWLDQNRRLLGQWKDRAKGRRRLREMSPEQLDDIGITRTEAAIEGRKPFWQS